ncbi:hypothetical protein BC936DRAFT_146928 [Jimgerdemannia flammicorona]|uniref:Histidine--tRNA ligase n=1 Tax=Jimgerdemannia flammicorona TaxID=994334 RepID=A0A433D6J9_9FUNG|nr:hypothetical protein BC936DRAFT_146928 [Jimgerdemannia flammicorona]
MVDESQLGLLRISVWLYIHICRVKLDVVRSELSERIGPLHWHYLRGRDGKICAAKLNRSPSITFQPFSFPFFNPLPSDRAQSKHPTSKKDTDELDELTVGVGSIAAGGRYDELVGMFTGKNKNRGVNLRIPCVGVSISVEHVFSIMLAKYRTEEIKTSEVQAFVVAASGGLFEERMAVAKELRDNEVKVSITV